MKFAFLSSIALLTAVPLAAQGTLDPVAVQAGTYKTDPNHTLVEFDVNHFGFTEFFGVFPGATGTLSLDPKAIAATKLDISVPIARVSTANPTLDGELRSAEWFDAGTYPTAHFVSAHVTPTGPRTARISGTITLHGVSKPFVLDTTFAGAGANPLSKAYTVGFQATGHLKRSDFGVTKYVPLVGDDVKLTISGAFEKTN